MIYERLYKGMDRPGSPFPVEKVLFGTSGVLGIAWGPIPGSSSASSRAQQRIPVPTPHLAAPREGGRAGCRATDPLLWPHSYLYLHLYFYFYLYLYLWICKFPAEEKPQAVDLKRGESRNRTVVLDVHVTEAEHKSRLRSSLRRLANKNRAFLFRSCY